MSRLVIITCIFLWLIAPLHAQNFEEETIFIESDGNRLGGVIMFPEGKKKKLPAVLIIQGSGPTDKDGNSEALTGKNNSLKLLAETLAKNGIASLRFDKRGIGLSKESAMSESDLTFDDFVTDAQAWLEYMKSDKRFKKIGIAGHSQGSLIGMRLSQDSPVKAFASIAGPSLSIDETIIAQIKANPFNPANVVKEAKEIFGKLRQGETVEKVPPYLMSIFRPSIQPFMMSWMKYDPLLEIEKLDIPILVITGSTDLQVTVEDAQRLQISNPKAELKVIDGMNHILKNSSAEANENVASYSNPNLPLNTEFEKAIANFFKTTLK